MIFFVEVHLSYSITESPRPTRLKYVDLPAAEHIHQKLVEAQSAEQAKQLAHDTFHDPFCGVDVQRVQVHETITEASLKLLQECRRKRR